MSSGPFRCAQVDEQGSVSQGSVGSFYASCHTIAVCGQRVYSTNDERDWAVMLARVIAEIKRGVDHAPNLDNPRP
jgi:hypothetical protein